MTFWSTLWMAVLVAGLLLFGVLAVWVTIGGARDIGRLFAALKEKSRDRED